MPMTMHRNIRDLAKNSDDTKRKMRVGKFDQKDDTKFVS